MANKEDKFAIHEAARNGQRERSAFLPGMERHHWLTCGSSPRRITAERVLMKKLLMTYPRDALTRFQADPKLARLRDDDDRLPLHWAVSYNHLPIVHLLVQAKGFDPDVAVCRAFAAVAAQTNKDRMAWVGPP